MKLTYIMILIAVLAFFLPQMFVEDPEAFYTAYGFSGANAAAAPYVLVTSIFLHASLIHLLSNILVWLFFGTAVEDELGKYRMLFVFLLGAFAGHALSLFFYPAGISVGASAGVFALIGIGMLVRPLDLSFYPLVVPLPLAFLGLLYAIYNAYAFIFAPDPTISYAGHFGGLAIGLIFGFRHTGVKHGLKIILVTLAVMALIPILWLLLTR